jgi:hypothetical protein
LKRRVGDFDPAAAAAGPATALGDMTDEGTSTGGGSPHVSGVGKTTVCRISNLWSSRKGVATFFEKVLRLRLAWMDSSKNKIADADADRDEGGLPLVLGATGCWAA